jgi:hypothetical protein
MLELAPVSLTRIEAGRDGRQYEVSGEANHIIQRLREIDPSLGVDVNEAGYFVVWQIIGADGAATPVETDTTERKLVRRIPWEDWDGRVIKEFEARAYEIRNGISAAARLDALDAKRSAATMHAFDEDVRERAYPLFRKMQRELFSSNPRVFISSGLSR